MLTLLAQAEVDPEGQLRLRQEPNDARFQRVFSGAYWQIADQQGKVLLQSRSLWDQTLAATADGPTQRNLAGPMQQSLRARVQQVRLPRAAQAYVAVVANDRSALDADVAAFRQRTADCAGGAGGRVAGVLASQVHFGLRPLRGLRQQLERIRRGDAVRIDRRQLDLEIAPLADELDALLDHHQRMVARARSSAEEIGPCTLVEDAASSVLAAETQGDGRDWRRTLHEQGARMRASIDRYLAAGLAVDHRQRSEVAPAAEALCRLMTRVHASRGIHFRVDVAPGLAFAGAVTDLEEMLGNLLDNACKWARHDKRDAAARPAPSRTGCTLKCATTAPAWQPRPSWKVCCSVACAWTNGWKAAAWGWPSQQTSPPATAAHCACRTKTPACATLRLPMGTRPLRLPGMTRVGLPDHAAPVGAHQE